MGRFNVSDNLSRDEAIDLSRDFVRGSHHPAKFWVHKPCESGDITFFICQVTTISKGHVALWVGSSHPKSTPPTPLSMRSIGLTEQKIMVFIISVPISIPIPIPMLKFPCRGLQTVNQVFVVLFYYFSLI